MVKKRKTFNLPNLHHKTVEPKVVYLHSEVKAIFKRYNVSLGSYAQVRNMSVKRSAKILNDIYYSGDLINLIDKIKLVLPFIRELDDQGDLRTYPAHLIQGQIMNLLTDKATFGKDGKCYVDMYRKGALDHEVSLKNEERKLLYIEKVNENNLNFPYGVVKLGYEKLYAKVKEGKVLKDMVGLEKKEYIRLRGRAITRLMKLYPARRYNNHFTETFNDYSNMLVELSNNPDNIELSSFIKFWKSIEGKPQGKGDYLLKMPSEHLPNQPIDYMINVFMLNSAVFLPYWDGMNQYTIHSIDKWDRLGLFDALESGNSTSFDKYGNATPTATLSYNPSSEIRRKVKTIEDKLEFDESENIDTYIPKEIKHFQTPMQQVKRGRKMYFAAMSFLQYTLLKQYAKTHHKTMKMISRSAMANPHIEFDKAIVNMEATQTIRESEIVYPAGSSIKFYYEVNMKKSGIIKEIPNIESMKFVKSERANIQKWYQMQGGNGLFYKNIVDKSQLKKMYRVQTNIPLRIVEKFGVAYLNLRSKLVNYSSYVPRNFNLGAIDKPCQYYEFISKRSSSDLDTLFQKLHLARDKFNKLSENLKTLEGESNSYIQSERTLIAESLVDMKYLKASISSSKDYIPTLHIFEQNTKFVEDDLRRAISKQVAGLNSAKGVKFSDNGTHLNGKSYIRTSAATRATKFAKTYGIAAKYAKELYGLCKFDIKGKAYRTHSSHNYRQVIKDGISRALIYLAKRMILSDSESEFMAKIEVMLEVFNYGKVWELSEQTLLNWLDTLEKANFVQKSYGFHQLNTTNLKNLNATMIELEKYQSQGFLKFKVVNVYESLVDEIVAENKTLKIQQSELDSVSERINLEVLSDYWFKKLLKEQKELTEKHLITGLNIHLLMKKIKGMTKAKRNLNYVFLAVWNKPLYIDHEGNVSDRLENFALPFHLPYIIKKTLRPTRNSTKKAIKKGKKGFMGNITVKWDELIENPQCLKDIEYNMQLNGYIHFLIKNVEYRKVLNTSLTEWLVFEAPINDTKGLKVAFEKLPQSCKVLLDDQIRLFHKGNYQGLKDIAEEMKFIASQKTYGIEMQGDQSRMIDLQSDYSYMRNKYLSMLYFLRDNKEVSFIPQISKVKNIKKHGFDYSSIATSSMNYVLTAKARNLFNTTYEGMNRGQYDLMRKIHTSEVKRKKIEISDLPKIKQGLAVMSPKEKRIDHNWISNERKAWLITNGYNPIYLMDE